MKIVVQVLLLVSPVAGDSTFVEDVLKFPMTAEQARFHYYNGCSWPEIGVLKYGRSAARLERKCRENFRKTHGVESKLNLRIVAEFKSRFLKSEYRLVFMPADWIGDWGQLGPETVLCQMRDRGNVMEPLRKTFPSIPTDWPLDFETPERVVQSDFVDLPIDSAEAVAAAIDLVTAACPEHPVVIIKSIYDIYELSNTLAGDWIWAQYEVDDSVKHLLTAIRHLDIDSNSYLSQNYPRVEYDREMFAAYDSLINRPTARIVGRDSMTVGLCSWTIGNGVLIRWNIVFFKGNSVRIYHELLADGLGFHFMCF